MRVQLRTVALLLCAGVAAVAVTCGGIAVIDHERAGDGGSGGATTGQAGGPSSTGQGGGPSSSASGYTCDDCQSLSAAGQLDNPTIDEASGLAASRKHEGVYYVHNDSGGAPEVFIIDAFGKQIGHVALPAAKAVDWEDIAMTPCPNNALQSCVMVGDIGDNPETRMSYELYVFPEPDDPAADHTLQPQTFSFAYPDGSHNAETLLVADNGTVVIVTKVSAGPSGIYRLPGLSPSFAVAELVGEVSPPLGVPMFTAGDAHPAAGVLLRTYSNVLYYPPVGQDLVATLQGEPCPMLAAAEPQGEAVTWRADGKGFLTVSEGAMATVFRYACGP